MAFLLKSLSNRSFLHGSSYHPPHILKSIVFSEAICMRRLNETQTSYIESPKRLQIKCLLSNFNKTMVDNMINIAKTWLNCLNLIMPKPKIKILNSLKLFGLLLSLIALISLRKRNILIRYPLLFINDRIHFKIF